MTSLSASEIVLCPSVHTGNSQFLSNLVENFVDKFSQDKACKIIDEF